MRWTTPQGKTCTASSGSRARVPKSWLDRRTNYTRSLGVMSMVGYILGLGDRHPSNLMLDRVTGKIIHIDFGDCFESRHEARQVPRAACHSA